MVSRYILCSVFFLLFAVLLPFESYAAETLSPQVRADLLSQRIVQEIEQDNRAQVLRSMDEYYELEKQGATIPVPLRLLDAETASFLGRNTRALCALESYLNSADRKESRYAQALKSYDSYVVAARSAEGSAEAQASATYCAARRPAPQATAPAPPATVYFLRRHNADIGYRWNMLVGAEDKVLGTMADAAFTSFKLPPGRHRFFARWQPDEPSSPDRGELELDVAEGSTYYLIAYCNKNSFTRAPVHVEQLDESTARQTWHLP